MKYTKTLLAIATMSALTMSCSDEDYFNKEEYDKIITESFPVDDVDPDHDWQTIGSADVQITLMQSGEGQSTIRIYDGEPSESGTSMLAKASLSNGETMNTSINYPIADPNVVISLTDPEGYRGYYYRTIEDGQLITNVGDQMVETTKATRAGETRATVTGVDYTFVDDYKGGVYPTSYSSDAIEYTGSMSDSKNYYFTPTSAMLLKESKLETKKNSVVYLTSGDYALNICSMAENSTLVLLDGANLALLVTELKSSSTGAKIIVCSGAKITRSDQIKLTNVSLYSQGSISCTADFKLISGAQFYNGGTLDVDKVSIEGVSQLVNAGTITTGGSVSVNGAFWNIGTTTCGSFCELNFANDSITKKNVFVNDGFLKAVEFKYSEGKVGQVFNSCKIKATTAIYLNLAYSTFNINAGASVITSDFQTNQDVPTYINMGANSMIDATKFEPKSSTITGPIGSDDGYALIKTEKFDGDNKLVSLQGKLYVDVKNDNWKDFENVSKSDYVKKFDPGNAKLDITKSECSEGYTGKPDETDVPETTSTTLRYCYEDNFPMAGDYDFNDVVLDITPSKVDGSNSVTYAIKLVAVGAATQNAAALHLDGVPASAIESVTISSGSNDYGAGCYDLIQGKFSSSYLTQSIDGNKDAVIYLFNDAHYMFTKTIASNGSVERNYINTVRTDDPVIKTGFSTLAPVEWTITVNFKNDTYVNTALKETKLDPFVVSEYNGAKWEVHTTKWQGKGMLSNYSNSSDYDVNRPWAICVPSSFKYPKEYVAVGSYSKGVLGGAYKTEGHSFGEWCKNRYQATDWYKNEYADEDQIYK